MRTEKRKGILTVISGFSGAGKGTVVKELVGQYNYKLSVSATTRQPREGEEDGVHYFFLTKEVFEDMIEKKDFFEWAQYVGNYYGTPKKYVEEQLEAGFDVILEIEIQGALKMKEQMPDALLLFITAPSAKELERRLTGRGTEEASVVRKRLLRASEEAEYMSQYDYLVVNDEVQACAERIHIIIESQHNRIDRCANQIDMIKEDLQAFKEGE